MKLKSDIFHLFETCVATEKSAEKRQKKVTLLKECQSCVMKLTDATIKKIVGALENGAPIGTACKIGRITKKTFYEWQKLGETLFEQVESGERKKKGFSIREKRLCEFYEKTSAANAIFELDLLKAIRGADKWQAWAWILERLNREEYARRTVQDTEAFLKTFEREHGSELAAVLQQVLDTAEAVAASNQTYDEKPLQGEKLKEAAQD